VDCLCVDSLLLPSGWLGMTMCGVGSLGTCRGLHDVKLARVRSLSSLVCLHKIGAKKQVRPKPGGRTKTQEYITRKRVPVVSDKQNNTSTLLLTHPQPPPTPPSLQPSPTASQGPELTPSLSSPQTPPKKH